MKSFYTIVSISPKPQLNEKLNVGLLCVSEEASFFEYSNTKLNVLKKLISPEAFKLAQATLNGIKETIHPKKKSKSTPLFEIEKNRVEEGYVAYLSRYNNNLVQFTEPKTIDLEINSAVYQKLFEKYIFKEKVQQLIYADLPVESFTSKRNHFRNAAKQYANVNYRVTSEVVNDLIAPVKVDVFGKNGAFVAGQTFDFSKNIDALTSEVTSYMYLSEHTHKMDQETKSYALGNEPAKKDKLNHLVWKNLQKSSLIELVPFDESERIIEYMKQKGVAPIETK